MGSFYSNIQLKSDLEKDKFIKTLKTKLGGGFEVCGKEEAEITYRLAFSENWVTFTRSEYKEQPNILNEDAEMLSRLLKTYAFTITVVDSDFALLSLFNNGNLTDDAVVGMGEGYGVEANPPQPSLWQPLLKSEYNVEELMKAWSEDEIFCESALGKSAPLFGIEKENIFADYKYQNEQNDENSLPLYFRKKSTDNSPVKLASKPTISKVFKDIFGEALEPLGFQSIEDDTFVKVIDNEVMQVIKLHKLGTKKKYITICARLITVYESPAKAEEYGYFWPTPYISRIYSSRRPEKYDDEFSKKIDEIIYDPNDEKDMERAVKEGLKYTLKVVIPHFNKVTNLSSYLLVNREINPSILGFDYILQIIQENKSLANFTEGMLYVKDKYNGDFLEFLQTEKEYEERMKAVKARNFTPPVCPIDYYDLDKSYSDYYNETVNSAKSLRSSLDRIITDKKVFRIIIDELERRKEINIKTLAKLGIVIGR